MLRRFVIPTYVYYGHNPILQPLEDPRIVLVVLVERAWEHTTSNCVVAHCQR